MLAFEPYNSSLWYSSGLKENHYRLVVYIIEQDGRSPVVPERLQNFSGSQSESLGHPRWTIRFQKCRQSILIVGLFSHQKFTMTRTKRLRPSQRTYPARLFFITGTSRGIGIAVAVALAKAGASFIGPRL